MREELESEGHQGAAAGAGSYREAEDGAECLDYPGFCRCAQEVVSYVEGTEPALRCRGVECAAETGHGRPDRSAEEEAILRSKIHLLDSRNPLPI